MTPGRTAAERAAEVRSAARAWRRAGAIDAPTLEAIQAAYPDERPTLAAAWKVLIFVVVTIASNAAFGFFVVVSNTGEKAGVWLLFAAVLAVATEALLRKPRVGDNGSAAATSFWAACYAAVGIAFSIERGARAGGETVITVSLLAVTVLYGAACWRWGYAAYSVFSALAFFLLLARFPAGRPGWLLVGGALLAATPRLQDRPSLAPPHRRAAGGILVVAAAAVYAAVNRYSLDQHLIESMREGGGKFPEPSAPMAVLSAAATAAFPVLLILWGLRSRRTLVLDVGAALAALSLVTLRYYVHLAPLWILLAGAGIALVLLALGLGRRLRRSPGEERRGFTARPLFSAERGGLETVAVVAAFAPDAAPEHGREPGAFTPGGGQYGGGGASGRF